MEHFNNNAQIDGCKKQYPGLLLGYRNELLIRTTALKNSKGIRLNEQTQSWRLHTEWFHYNSLENIVLKRENIDWLAVVKDWEEKGPGLGRSSTRKPCGGDGIAWSGGDGDCTMIKLHRSTHTNLNTCKTGETWMSSVDCTNVIFLVLTLYYINARCQYWETLGEGCTKTPCKLIYNFL